MTLNYKALAAVAALAAGIPGIAAGQVYSCPSGYAYADGACQPMVVPAPGGVVGGAASAAGGIVGGALNAAGSIAGGAVNAAGNVVGGTVGAVTGAPPPQYYGSSVPPAPIPENPCTPGYVFYRGACYPQ